ncbi:MAG: sigma 54-interacting transcriptional regulator, partial [Myxococcota bacterium]|nr:sigma 54-interacting transcriptional regulator [Myxococcota bacterium]
MPSLVINGQRRYFIARKLTTVGRGPDNDLILNESEIELTHAVLKIDSGRFIINPTSRKHPVLINGKKVRKHVLEHGDLITIANTQLRFDLWDEPDATGSNSPPDPTDELDAYERLCQFSMRLADTDSVEILLSKLMDEVITLTGAAKGFLLLKTQDGFDVKTARNLNHENIADNMHAVSDSIVETVLSTGKPLIVSDALNDTMFSASRSVIQLRLCSVMCVPLVFARETLGVIYVGNDNVVSLFEKETLSILSVFCAQAALLVANAIQRDELTYDNARLRVQLEGHQYGELIGTSGAMRDVFARIEKTAQTNVSVLIRGETGTGKELIAREIHKRSKRAAGPFIAVNCGALATNLIESALFGHKKGAYTGAHTDKVGCFQQANGGTLFLDEIGEMPKELQVKLLRAIQERRVTRLGSNRVETVDIRLLTATHVDLETAIKEHRFRQDLYYRINVLSVDLPPLRERGEDRLLLAQHFVSKLAAEYGKS